MVRAAVLMSMVLGLLGGCGQTISITLPGGQPPGKPPKGYELLFSPAPHAFRFSAPGEPVRRGKVSERFELRDGDCGGTDCDNSRYRSEIREVPGKVKARIGKDIWYGWSFYNESVGTVTRDTTLGAVFGQWKVEGDRPPVFRLAQTVPGAGDWATCNPAICNPVSGPTPDVVVELEDMSTTYGWGVDQNFGKICQLFSLAENRGKWVDIVVNTNFAAGPDGYLRVWINGQLKCNYYGQLVSSGEAGDRGPGIRRGIFGSYTKRWDETQGDSPKPTLVVFYDEFLTGAARDRVDPGLRELSALRPKD